MSRPAWTAFFFFIWLALYAAWSALRPMEPSFERGIRKLEAAPGP